MYLGTTLVAPPLRIFSCDRRQLFLLCTFLVACISVLPLNINHLMSLVSQEEPTQKLTVKREPVGSMRLGGACGAMYIP